MKTPCQTQGCAAPATQMLRSRKTGLELHLCRDCASAYHVHGWEKIRGDVELLTGDLS